MKKKSKNKLRKKLLKNGKIVVDVADMIITGRNDF